MKKILAFPVFLTVLVWCGQTWSLEPGKLLEKVREAQEKLKEIPIALETQEIKKKIPSKKNKRQFVERKEEIISGKQIALLAWDPDEDKDHIVYLRVSHPLPKGQLVLSMVTLGYKVEHVSGRTVSKLVFKVWQGEKKLIVLAGKHFWIPPELSQNQNYELLKERAEEAIYTPYAEDLYSEDAVFEGAKFLYSEIKKVQADLCKKGIMSRALPGKLICEAINWELVFNLGHNEQMDHEKFKNDRKHAAEEISNEYAFNLANSFRWAVSSANARGAYQFTNRSGSGKSGTYDIVAGAYEDAELIEDFEEGARDLQNMIKAAICLIDLELSKFPKEIHELFAKDYRLGGIFPVDAYNEGGGGAIQLYRWVKKNKFELSADKELPLTAFVRHRTSVARVYDKAKKQYIRKKITKKVTNPEPYVYIQKYLFLWKFIGEFKEQLK